MVVAIDGPAGAGKSVVSRLLADRLGFRFLDTGAMYRAVTLAAIKAGANWHDALQLRDIASQSEVRLEGETVLLDGVDVSQEIRTPLVTEHIRFMANDPEVRAVLVREQRATVADADTVTEGRDQGTVVFPTAECKIYLTASPEERARRRVKDYESRGLSADYDAVLEKIKLRDEQDMSRDVGPLKQAEDAVLVTTDDMTLEQVVDHLESLVRQARAS